MTGLSGPGAKNDAPISASEIRAARDAILASDAFSNAPRMSRLFRFLVEQAICGDSRSTSEFAIGIEVFDRDPATYSTSEDPIVRVQVGRLRDKLISYYETQKDPPGIEFAIPLGSYMPTIRQRDTVNRRGDSQVLAIREIQCIAPCEAGEPFTRGLHEELVHQLFRSFGNIVVTHPLCIPGDHAGKPHPAKPSNAINHLLEGSVRIDSKRIRTSMRLVDITQGRVAWSEQFDRNTFFAIEQQEELATSICGALKQYLRL